jgi:hypothetical protein
MNDVYLEDVLSIAVTHFLGRFFLRAALAALPAARRSEITKGALLDGDFFAGF